MKRYEGALRRLSILFLFISLFSPLNQLSSFDDNRALAQDGPDPLGTGVLSITLLDDVGSPVGGAGFSVVDSQGRTQVGSDPDGNGVTEVFDVAAGDVSVTQNRFPEGYSTSLDPTYAYVAAGQVNFHTVYTATLAQPQALQVQEAPPPDSDGDGIIDASDSCPLNWNLGTDWDGDGIDDACDPNPDRDADGLANDVEANLGTNPDAWDSDGDGLGDGDEVNVYGTNPLLADTDGDGVGDGAEINAGTNPLVAPPADSDVDGIPDVDDSCPAIANTGIDTDGDGIDDACDPLNDADGDGIDDAVATQQALDAQATQQALDAVATRQAADAQATQAAADAQATQAAADALATEQAVPTATSTPEPAPELVVTQRVLDADGAEITSAEPGDTVTFEVTVSNASNVGLTNITVANSLKGLGKLACDPADLASLVLDGKIICTATYKVSEQDQKTGTVENVVTVTSAEVKADPVTTSLVVADPEASMRSMDVGTMALISDNQISNEFRGVDPGGSGYDPSSPTDTSGTFAANAKTSLQPAGALQCNGYVHFWNLLSPSASGEYTFTVVYATRTTNNQAIGYDGLGAVFLDTSDPVFSDPGGNANVTTSVSGSFAAGGNISVTYTVTGLDAGDKILVRTSMHLRCDTAQTGGNVHSALVGSSQTVPLSTGGFVEPVVDMTVSKACPDIPTGATVGSQISYPITITNIGTVTLSVTGIDESARPGGTFTYGDGTPVAFPFSVLAGGSSTVYYNSTITQADLDAQKASNTAIVSATYSGNKPTTLTKTASTPDCTFVAADADISISKQCAETDATAVRKLGDPVTFNVTVTNEGNVPLTSVNVIDTRTGDGEGFLDGGFSSDFPVGHSETRTFTAIITADDMAAGKVVTEVSVTSKFGTADVTSGPITAECLFVAANASITISKQCAETETGVLQVGETVTFSVTVHNDGNVALTDVMVQDTRAGPGEGFDSPFPNELAAGQTETRTFTAVITAADVTAGAVNNSASVTAMFNGDETGDATDLVPCAFTPYAAIAVSKTCPDTASVRVGDTISYPVTIENTGDIPLTGITVTESRTGTFDPELPTSLAVGGTYEGTFTYTVTDADVTAGHLDNTITVTTTEGETQESANGAATAECAFTPVMSYTFTKACVEPSGPLAEGETVTYSLTLTNTGDVELTNIELTDSRAGDFGDYPHTLARGASFDVTFTSTVTADDIANATFLNTAYLNATAGSTTIADAEAVTPNGQGECAFEPAAPSISIGKVCPEFAEGEQPRLGDEITFTITVENTGNRPLTNVVITDDRDPAWQHSIHELAVGSGPQVVTFTSTVTGADVAAGTLDNTAHVTTDQAATFPAAASTIELVDECLFEPYVDISVTKACAELAAQPRLGDELGYQVIISNDSDVPVTISEVVDTHAGGWGDDSANNPVGQTIQPDGDLTVTYYGTLTADDIAAGNVDNTVTVTAGYTLGESTISDTASDTAECGFAPFSEITIAKACVESQDLTGLRVGQTVQFSVTITNTGDTTLENITVADDRDGDFDLAFPDTLAPGSGPVTRVFTTTVTAADALAGTVANNVSVSADTTIGGQLVEAAAGDEASASCDFTPYVDISVTKTCAELAAQPRVGDALSYPITIVNNSDVPVTISMVTDSRIAGDAGALAPNPAGEVLAASDGAPGGDDELTIAYVGTLTAADAAAGTVDNTVSVSAGYTLGGTTISDTASDTAACPFAALASIAIGKVCPDLAGVRERDSVSYPVTITNTGDVDLTGLDITDTRTGTLAPNTGFDVIDDAFVLSPNETWEGTFTSTVTFADTNAGHLNNSISVSTTEGATAEDDIACPFDAYEAISISKVCQEIAQGSRTGDPVSYTIAVENTGDVDLTNVVITDSRDAGWSHTIATLGAGGEPVEVLFTTTITDADAAAGSVANTAYVVSDQTGQQESSDSCALTPATGISISKICPEIPNGARIGADVVYNVTIVNEGDVELTGMSVTEPRAGTWSETPPTTLAPRASWSGTFTTQITSADAALGSVNNTISVTANAVYGPEADPVTVQVDGQSIANCGFIPTTGVSIGKACPEQDLTGARVGAELIYQITVVNTGDVELTNIVVTDTRDAGWSATIASIPVGGSDLVTFTSAITPEDAAAGNVDNTAVVVADVIVGGATTTLAPVSFTVECPFVPTTGVSISKTCPEPAAGTTVGTSVTYSVTIINDGDVPLTGIVVDEARAGTWSEAFPATLAAGASATRVFTSPITLADAAAGSIDNTASVTADVTVGEVTSEVRDSTTLECPFTPVTGIAISKTCPEPASLEDAEVGDPITYQVTITNTGDVALTGISVIDARVGSLAPDEGYAALADSVLAPQGEAGDTWTGTFTSAITSGDAANGNINNTISALATATYGSDNEPISGTVQSGDVFAECAFNPVEGISITKACVEPQAGIRVGENVTYNVTITNTGDVELSGIAVTESRDGTWSPELPTMLAAQGEAGDTWTGTFTSMITLDDAANGNVDNSIAVTADAPSGQTTVEVGADDTAECLFVPVKGIEITKTCPEIDPDARVGDEITYQVTITNTGDITLEITSVTDDRGGEFDSAFPATLAPAGQEGDSATRTFTSTITLADATSGNVNNTVTANTGQGVGDTFTTESCAFNPVEGISITKACVEPEAGTRAGESVAYNVTITNTGDVALANIEVDDDRAGIWSPELPTTLAAAGEDGDSWTGTFTSTITLADAASGNVDNTVSVTADAVSGNVTTAVDDEATAACAFNPVEGIVIAKTCPEIDPDARVGDEIAYQVTITNTGDVELAGFLFTDNRDGSLAPNEGYAALADLVLAPAGQDGDTWVGTFSSTITLADAASGNVDNTATISASALQVLVTDTFTTGDCVFDPVEGIAITKTCVEPETDARVGDPVSYAVTITNTGDVELTGVVVTDLRPGGFDEPFPTTLAPAGQAGDSATRTFTSTITLADAAAGNVDNTASVNASATSGDTIISVDDEAMAACAFTSVTGIAITKTCIEPEAETRVGDTVTYNVTISNTGDVELSGIAVTESRDGTWSPELPTTLAAQGEAGDSWTGTFTSTITLADAASGNVDNTIFASATATYGPDNQPVSETVETDDVAAECAFAPVTGLTVAKTCVEPEAGSRVGEDVTYNVTITNTGDVALTDIEVDDDRAGTWSPELPATLAPAGQEGDSWTGNFTSSITLADAASGNVDNTISASATATHGSGDAAVSETVETGNVTAQCAFTPVTGLAVSKTCPELEPGARVGDEIAYVATIINTGDLPVTLSNVLDARATGMTPDPTGLVLAPSDGAAGGDDELTVTITSTITLDDAAAGNVNNQIQAVGVASYGAVENGGATDIAVESNTYLAECLFVPVTGIAIGKTCGEPGEGARVGDEVTYTVTIENTGDIALTNIVVLDNRDGTWNEPFPASLAPQGEDGDSATLTFTTTIRPDDARDGNLDNGVSVTSDAVIGAPAQVETLADIALMAQASVSTVVVTDTIDIDCPFIPVTGITVSKTCPDLGEGGRVGDEVSYQVTITNTGDVAVEILSIVDERDGTFAPDPATLAPLAPKGSNGDSVTLTFTTTILASDAESNNVNNSVTVQGQSTVGEATVAVGGEASAECGFAPLQNLEMGKTCPEPEAGVRVGDEIAYEVTITNTGDVILYNVVVTDVREGAWNEPFPVSLNPGQTETRIFTTVVTSADAENGNLDNTVLFAADRQMGEMPSVLSITQVQVGEDGSMTAEVMAECPFEPIRGLALEKTASTPEGEEVTTGSVITYTFAVTNTGDTTLVNVVVVDQLDGLVWDEANADGLVGDLAPGETKTITATYVVTQADVNAGNVHNTAISTDGETESPPDETDTPLTQAPAIDLVKTAVLVNGEEVPYPVEHLMLGDEVTYELIATNTGNVDLTDVTITDPMEGLSALECDPAMPATLGVGDSLTCLATYVITQENIDGRNVDNTATVTGIAPDETEVSDTDTERIVGHFEPILVLEKSAATPEGEAVVEGTVITYTFVATNTGNITIHNIVVNDPLPGLTWSEGSENGEVGTLDPGASASLTATYVVTATDVVAGNVHNTAIATGELPFCLDGCEVESPPAEVTVPVTQGPAIDLVKTATLVNGEEVPYPVEHLMLGDEVTYELIATNTGNVSLTDVTITDPMEGLSALECDPAMPGTLAPGETMTCLATYVISQENIDGRNVDNTATATGTAPDGSTVTDTDTERVVGHFEPILEITKTASPDRDVKKGDTITYTFVVTNTGNITINDIVVVDELTGLVWSEANADGNVGTLAPGASATLTATYVVTKADVKAGQVHNVAIAEGTLTTCLEEDECDVTSPPAEVTVPVVQPKPPVVITPKPKPVAGLPNTGSGSAIHSDDLGWSVALMTAVVLAATAAGIRRRTSV